MRALLLPLGDDLYAVPLARAREILPWPPVTPLPTAPGWVLGVSNLRGEVIPVLDTAALLGVGDVFEPSHAVVVTTPRGPGALAATAMPEALELGDPVGVSELPAGRGRFEAGVRVATLLDLDALLDGPSPRRT